MRNLKTVINEMLAVIPDTFDKKNKMERIFSIIEQDSRYHAPEIQHFDWQEVSYVLIDNLPSVPEEEWQWQLSSIFTTKSVDELKSSVPKNSDKENDV